MLVEGRMWPWEVVEGLTFLYGRLQHYNHCSSFNVPNVFFFQGLGDPPQDPSSARQRKPPSGSGSRGGSGAGGKGQHVRSSTDPSLRGTLMVSPATSR